MLQVIIIKNTAIQTRRVIQERTLLQPSWPLWDETFTDDIKIMYGITGIGKWNSHNVSSQLVTSECIANTAHQIPIANTLSLSVTIRTKLLIYLATQ